MRPAQPWKPQGDNKPLFPRDRLCTERVPASARPRGRTCRGTWRESPWRGDRGYPILVQWGNRRKGTPSREFLQHLRVHGTLTTTFPFLPEALGPVFGFRGGGIGSRQPHKLRIRNLVWGRPPFLQILWNCCIQFSILFFFFLALKPELFGRCLEGSWGGFPDPKGKAGLGMSGPQPAQPKGPLWPPASRPTQKGGACPHPTLHS